MASTKTIRDQKARYPIATSVSKAQYDRIQKLRKECLTLISELLEEGCKAVERKKGIRHEG